MDEATLRLAIGLILLGFALVVVGIGILKTEAAAQSAAADAAQSERKV